MNLETWRDNHHLTEEQERANIAYLREIAGRMEEMIRGQNRRLEILENGNGLRLRPH